MCVLYIYIYIIHILYSIIYLSIDFIHLFIYLSIYVNLYMWGVELPCLPKSQRVHMAIFNILYSPGGCFPRKFWNRQAQAARGALHPWPSQSLGFADLQIDWQSQSVTIPSGNTQGKPWFSFRSWICSWSTWLIHFQVPNIGAIDMTNKIIISIA